DDSRCTGWGSAEAREHRQNIRHGSSGRTHPSGCTDIWYVDDSGCLLRSHKLDSAFLSAKDHAIKMVFMSSQNISPEASAIRAIADLPYVYGSQKQQRSLAAPLLALLGSLVLFANFDARNAITLRVIFTARFVHSIDNAFAISNGMVGESAARQVGDDIAVNIHDSDRTGATIRHISMTGNRIKSDIQCAGAYSDRVQCLAAFQVNNRQTVITCRSNKQTLVGRIY